MKFLLCFLLFVAIASVAMAYPDANPYANPFAAEFHGLGREGGDEAPGYRAIFSGHEGGGNEG
jgi:hypothetical protein